MRLSLLLAKGAKANPRNKVGGTPLMWAGTYGQDDIARELLANGADARLKDEDGHTAAYWADANKHSELAAELRNAESGRQKAVGRLNKGLNTKN